MRLGLMTLVLLAGCSGSTPTPEAKKESMAKPAGEVALKVVKWPELEKAIADQKGKVVVLDIWADFCIPCKKEFPHLVELHEKFAGRGVVAMSVSVDEAKGKDRALEFLKKKGATFSNYLIDEPADVWEVKLDAGAPPTVLVYGKDGKRAAKFTSENAFTYADVEKVVEGLVK